MLPHTVQSHALNLLLAWALLAFGGVYLWALVPIALGAILLLASARPRIPSEHDRTLDLALLASLLVIAIQLVPLPRVIVRVIAPGTIGIADAMSLSGPRSFVPLSVWPSATVEAIAVVAGAIAVFWAARQLFRYQGVRRAIRTVAWCGVVAAFAGLLQRKSGSALVYGFWQPVEAGAWPFGPFINRNYFATWVLMAIPLCAGYLIARRPARLRKDFRPWRVRVASALDGRAVWLMTAIGLMTVALFASLSRSGLAGMAAVLIVGWAGAQWRPDSRRWYWALLVLAAVSVMVLFWGDVPNLLARLDSTRVLEPTDRVAIWRDTWSLVRSHWLTGVGAGAYERAMPFYQQTDRTYYDNQAHNQLLQIVADGGLLLLVPALVALVTLVTAALRRLRGDRSGMYWVRLGALAGLSGVAVQSVWETGLRAPGNAILSAVLAAILLHEPLATSHSNRTAS